HGPKYIDCGHQNIAVSMATAATLRALSEVLQGIGLDTDTIANRRTKWRKLQNAWCAGLAKQEEQAEIAETITPPLVMELLREVVGADCNVVDDVIIHQTGIRENLSRDDPLTFFRAPSGLGKGLEYALGVKLALPKRSVIVTIGDGSFMHNPVVTTLTLSDEHSLPLIILVFTNSQYAIMKHFHKRFYLDGVAVADDVYYGVKICGPRYEESATMIGGIGQRVKIPESCEMRSQQPTQASGPARPRS
ncbi:MAG: thiamine pyrophosphate-dependent enzyme, partial [Pseudomonadota bacterium]|nr:thiamine pyrophosphate-dependent enzyme [Pseudomonadota bacterium]